MGNTTKRKALKRLQKRLRRLALRHPWLVGVLTFLVGLLAKSVATYLLSTYVLPRAVELIRGFTG